MANPQRNADVPWREIAKWFPLCILACATTSIGIPAVVLILMRFL